MADIESKIANLSPAKQALLARRRGQSGSASEIKRRPDRDEAPLSFPQQRLWLTHLLDPDSYLYNVPRYLRLTGPLDIPSLQASLNEIVRRHEILRTTFHERSGQPTQKISPERVISVPVVDLSQAAGLDKSALALELALEEYRRPFDLVRGPLIRVNVWRISGQEHRLLLVMHHIVSDGWTGGVLFEELATHYHAFCAGKTSTLAELPIQYADFALWQNELIAGTLDKQLAYWRDKLIGAPARLELPADHTAPKSVGSRGHVSSLLLSPSLSQDLTEFARTQGMTLFPLVLAGLKALLLRWTNQRDLVVGTISANRSLTEVEKLIGCFMNFLALRDTIDDGDTGWTLIAKVKQTVMEAFSHQDCPFEKIVEELRPQRTLSANPLYNVAVQLQNYPEFAFRGDGLEARFLPFDTQVAFLDLRFLVTETRDGILLECESNADLFEQSTGDLLLAGYRDTLQQLVATPELTVVDFQIPTALAHQAKVHSHAKEVVAIAATFTAEPVQKALDFWMGQLGIPANIRFAPYDQVFQQLLDPAGLLSANQGGTNVVLLRIEDLYPFEKAESEGTPPLEATLNELTSAVRTAGQQSLVPCIICVCPPSAAVRTNTDWKAQCDRAERRLTSELNDTQGVQLITSSELLATYPVADYDDEYAFKMGHIPYTSAMFAGIATAITRLIYRARAIPRQVIVLGCDSTLWMRNGADRAKAPVEINQWHLALQNGMLSQLDAGRILCLVSTNSEASIATIFEEHPDMPLGLQHVTASSFGLPISGALSVLAEELGLPLSRFIYIDADPLTCADVRTTRPEVLVAEIPNHEPARFLQNFWPLDKLQDDPQTPLKTDSATLARIASDLTTPVQILRAVEVNKTSIARNLGHYVAPRSPTEELLADMWSQLLNVEKPSVQDNFFALGGHSLLAVQLLAKLRGSLGIELPLRTIFSAPTIAELAERIETARAGQAGSGASPLAPVPREGVLPLSFAQQRLWFIDQLEPGNPLYNIPQMYRMSGILDRFVLETTINEIVRRHESLRTTFHTIDGQPAQVIAPQLRIPLSVVTLSGEEQRQREVEVRRIASELALQPFDLALGPLLRATLLECGEQEHVLLLTLHHIVGDGWSGNLLARELVTLYEALSRDLPCPLPDLAIQYADFALWQRSWLQGKTLEIQVDYWKKQLAEAPAVLELPTDRPRPAIQQHRGSVQTHLFPPELLKQVKSISQSEGATLFMTLLACFQLLLSRYSGQEDIVVGSPVAGRNYTEIEPLIGFFVNTLALRTDLTGDPTFRDLLAKVKHVALDAFAHQEIPFERLVEELRPERSLSYNPIFQVMFGLQKAPHLTFQLDDLRIERTAVHQQTSVFDLSWFAFENEEGLLVRVEYETDLFDAATIARSFSHFENLLRAVSTNPEQRLSEISLFGKEEIHEILVEFNDTAVEYPKCCIQDLLAAQFRLTPDATALIDGELRLTYRELDERSSRVANFLVKRGAGPDVPIGIYCERSIGLIAGILGIVKAGSAYVPLDPGYPKERLGHILEDSRARLVLTQQSIASDIPQFEGELINLDLSEVEISNESNIAPSTKTNSSNLAYILFTSGSTGRPKGVALEHRTPVTFIQWCKDTFSHEELAGVLFATSVCFDVSVFEIFVTLSAGGKVILAQNALYLPTLPARNEVTLINTVPSVMAELIRMRGVPCSVKTVNLAGEALPDAMLEEIYSSTDAEKVYNLYGPTETSYSTFTLADRGRPVTIGKPIANTQCYILDRHMQPVPIGVTGELYIAGDGEARGYYGRPDLTSERFIPNPFSGARMYKTGDVCRWLPDGNIQYFGRADHQVKLRGFRIELGEIEATLDRHPSVRQSVVLVREDEPGLKRLVAYVMPQPGAEVQAEGLRDYIKRSLPEFMVPSAVVTMESFPLTPNGKVNRKALPIPTDIGFDSNAYVAPRTPIEENVVAIWEEVLRVPRVGVQDDFFTLGGHSLLATQVMSRIRLTLEVELPLRTIFESPVLSSFAANVEAVKRTQTRQEHPPLVPVSRSQSIPLSFAQQRMWFVDQLEPDNPVFNIPCALRVNFRLNTSTLQQCIDALVERHETLRTNFTNNDGEPVQVIVPERKLTIDVIDLSQLPDKERENEALRIVAAAARKPFDLALDPLLRVIVLRLSEDADILFLNIHHIISDRWSVTVMLQELSALYGAFSEGQPSPLQELPVQYADFSAWQHKVSRSAEFESQLAYWTEHLRGAPPMIELPTDRPRPPVASLKGESASIEVSPALVTKLHHLSRTTGSTLFMTLLAAFEVLLSRYSGQEDLVVGMPIASRGHQEIEGLIGLFANTLPLRLNLASDPSFREVLARTKDAALGAYAHQDVPFEQLVEALHPERSLSYDPLVQIYFILQNAPHEGLKLRGLDLKHIETDSKTAKGDLYFSLAERDGGLYGRLEYNTDLFDTATISRFLGHYRSLLESAVDDPDQPMSQLTILSEEERQQLLVDWQSTDADYPRHLCVHQLFEKQAACTPDAIAVVFGKDHLTYSDLNRRANQIAHALRQRGMRVGHRVGIFVNRTLDMMIGLLGIQKSGAAYVPLDPSYPTERLRLTLEDAQVPVILTQKALLTALPEHNSTVLCLDSDWSLIEQNSTANPESGASSGDAVYVIFTSGTTGRPKGVQVPHRAVVNLLNFMRRELQMGSDDVFPALASYAFDMCIPELYLALVSGGRTVLGSQNLASNGEELAAMLRENGATIVHATPTTWNLLLEAGFTGKGLKRAIGAEPLPRDLCTRLLEAGDSLYNFYGPTETTVWSALHHFRSPAEPVVVGRPLDNTQIYILDRKLQLVPAGVPGEIHIAGDGVALGYLNRPDLTAEKFIPDPFSNRPSARMYKTGDLGRFLPDGRIEFQGRLDNQVKVRGYRIELSEIETVLGSHPSVQECVVIAREDVAGDKRLAAYMVPAPNAHLLPSELRLWVKERLPDYMVPAAWVEMDRLPLSPNGKVDRKSLPVPEYIRPELSAAFQQARTPTEEVIAGIWAEILQLNQVGLQDDFFELGGHSLLATQVVSRIRQAFKVELPLRALFENPSVAGLADRVETLQRKGQGVSTPPLRPAPRNRPLPLSFAQQRLWFLDQLEPNNPLYNVPYIVRMKGPLDAKALESSLHFIVARHESLRTTFQMLEDEPVQIIAPELIVPLMFTDLTSLPEAERVDEARRLVMVEIKRPFDLRTGPLLRAALFKLDEQDHALILNTHHIVSDRWSLGVLSQELATLYESLAANLPSTLTELPIQYADYARWQREFMSGDILNEQLNYWKQQLDGAPSVLELPTDRLRKPGQDFWGVTYKQVLPPDLVSALRTLSRKSSATFFMSLLAGFQILLARYAHLDDIVIGTDLANRTQLETEKLIGFFVNLLPIRTRLSGDPTFSEVLSRVREASLGAYAHQDIPFDKLVEELQPERTLTHNPLVQVLFVMQNTPKMVLEFGGLTIGPLGVTSSSRFDLVLFINDPDSSPSATWMYNPNLFDSSTLAGMAALYEGLLRTVSENPLIQLSSLHESLAEQERQQREAKQNEFQEASLRKLKQVRRRTAVQM